jgi:hypothetical protein
MSVSPRTFLTAVVSLGIACAGCTSGSGSLPSLISVKGKVTYKGQPVTTGVVQFEPDDYGRNASGNIQSDGTYELTTFKPGDGVVAGHHRISITDTGRQGGRDVVPKKYARPNTSKLTADVDPAHTEFNFDLVDGR